MNVLLFGVLAEVVGKPILKIQATDLDSLNKNLLIDFPKLKNYKFQVAVNKQKVEKNILLKDDDEIALLPPFAGG